MPRLGAAQVAHLALTGRRRTAAAGEVIFEQGDEKRGLFVLLEGRVEIVSPSHTGEIHVTLHEAW